MLLLSPTFVQNDVISKLCTCAISLAIYLSLYKLLPVERSIDDDFVNSTPFHLQVVYLYLAMLALRPKYYFVWTLGEFDLAFLSVNNTFPPINVLLRDLNLSFECLQIKSVYSDFMQILNICINTVYTEVPLCWKGNSL